MRLYIKTGYHEMIPIDTDANDSILRVMALTLEKMCLQFNSTVLDLNRTVESYGIVGESILTVQARYTLYVQLYIRQYGGMTVQLKVRRTEKVKVVKERIQLLDPRCRVQHQLLFYSGLLLSDDRTLSSYGINNDALVDVAFKGPANMAQVLPTGETAPPHELIVQPVQPVQSPCSPRPLPPTPPPPPPPPPPRSQQPFAQRSPSIIQKQSQPQPSPSCKPSQQSRQQNGSVSSCSSSSKSQSPQKYQAIVPMKQQGQPQYQTPSSSKSQQSRHYQSIVSTEQQNQHRYQAPSSPPNASQFTLSVQGSTLPKQRPMSSNIPSIKIPPRLGKRKLDNSGGSGSPMSTSLSSPSTSSSNSSLFSSSSLIPVPSTTSTTTITPSSTSSRSSATTASSLASQYSGNTDLLPVKKEFTTSSSSNLTSLDTIYTWKCNEDDIIDLLSDDDNDTGALKEYQEQSKQPSMDRQQEQQQQERQEQQEQHQRRELYHEEELLEKEQQQEQQKRKLKIRSKEGTVKEIQIPLSPNNSVADVKQHLISHNITTTENSDIVFGGVKLTNDCILDNLYLDEQSILNFLGQFLE